MQYCVLQQDILFSRLFNPRKHPDKSELEDLKVLKRSPDNWSQYLNVNLGLGQPRQLHIIFEHI